MGFVLAEKHHDRQIRKLLYQSDMPGSIRVAYCREPDYFRSITVCGKLNQTLIYERDKEIKAMSVRSIKPVFIDGEVVDFGYLSGLRIVPGSRGNIILGRGYQALKELHNDYKVKGYLTTIVDKNSPAKSVLTSGKANIPRYLDIGKYHVYTVLFNRYKKFNPNKIDIVNGRDVSLKQIIRFLHENGIRKQFYPMYTVTDFNNDYTRDFMVDHFYVAIQDSKIIGIAGIWNQTKFKQHVISSYTGIVKRGKLIIDTALHVAGFKPLPKKNEVIKTFTVSFVCIMNDDQKVLSSLLNAIYADKINSDFYGFSIGFHEDDTLQQVMKNFFHIPYTSNIYLVYWEDGKQFCEKIINNRVPYLELGTL